LPGDSVRAVESLAEAFDARSIRYALIGGLARALADATPYEWTEAHTVRVATAEGLIVTKMVAFRPQDQVDIETLLTANRDTIDLQIIREEWSPFAATEAERTAWLEDVIARRVVRRE
jgi:hypothetical protein